MIFSRKYVSVCPAAKKCFFFEKRISYFLLGALILFKAHGVLAFFSDGKINDDFSYRSFRVEMLKTKGGGCYFEGEILNNTSMTQEDVSLTVYAFDYFDHSLWKQTIRIDIIDPFDKCRKGYPFRKKLSRCDMPAKFQFKVTGVKKNDAKKAIRAKPKSKNMIPN